MEPSHSFDGFVAARLPALLRYATVVTCDPHLAEDVVQEVLVRAQARWGRIAALEQPEAYLRRMVLNEFLSWRRRLGNRTAPRWTQTAPVRTVADPAGQVAERDALLRLIAALPPRQRAVIALRFYEDRSDAEIAELLGCREGTVRAHCSRALATLRVAMSATEPAPGDQGDRTPTPIEGTLT